MIQIQGIVDGYNSKNNGYPLTLLDILLLNADGDVEDLILLKKNLNITNIQKKRKDHLRCSALFKLKDDYSDIM